MPLRTGRLPIRLSVTSTNPTPIPTLHAFTDLLYADAICPGGRHIVTGSNLLFDPDSGEGLFFVNDSAEFPVHYQDVADDRIEFMSPTDLPEGIYRLEFRFSNGAQSIALENLSCPLSPRIDSFTNDLSRDSSIIVGGRVQLSGSNFLLNYTDIYSRPDLGVFFIDSVNAGEFRASTYYLHDDRLLEFVQPDLPSGSYSLSVRIENDVLRHGFFHGLDYQTSPEAPSISSFFDRSSNSSFLITPGGMAEIEGDSLDFDPADHTQGLFFYQEDNHLYYHVGVVTIDPNLLVFENPVLPSASYFILVTARRLGRLFASFLPYQIDID